MHKLKWAEAHIPESDWVSPYFQRRMHLQEMLVEPVEPVAVGPKLTLSLTSISKGLIRYGTLRYI